jgi:hypothetical protein
MAEILKFSPRNENRGEGNFKFYKTTIALQQEILNLEKTQEVSQYIVKNINIKYINKNL